MGGEEGGGSVAHQAVLVVVAWVVDSAWEAAWVGVGPLGVELVGGLAA